MTTRKKPVRTRGEMPGETLGSDDEQDQETVFDRQVEDSYIVVRKRDDTLKQWVYVCRLTHEEATEETLQAMGGGGEYRMIEFVPNEAGNRFVYGRQRTIRIAGEPKPIKAIKAKPVSSTGGPVSAGRGGDREERVGIDDVMTAGILDLMRANKEINSASSESLLAIVKAMQSQPKAGPLDLAAVLAALAPIVTALFQYLQSRSGPPDQTELLLKAAALFKEHGSPAINLKEQLETMESYLGLKGMALDLMQDSKDGGGGDPIEQLVMANLPKVIEVIERASHQPRGGSGPGQAPPSSTAIVREHQPSPQPSQQGAGPMWGRLLQQYGRNLAKMAGDGKNPDICAASLWELMIPEALRGHVREFIQRPDAMEQLLLYVPQLRDYEQWAGEFMAALYDTVMGGDDDGGDDERYRPGVTSEVQAHDEAQVHDSEE